MKTKQITKGLRNHIVDTTALLTASNPIYSTFETCVAGMSDGVSMNARLIASGISYLGMGFIFVKGRDVSRKAFKINDKTKETIQQTHDIIYTVGMNLIFAPPIYFASGEIDIKKIVIGTGTAMAFSAVTGGPMGYAVDAFRDLTGIKESERVPKLIRKQKPLIKKGLAALLVGTSIAAMAGIYSLTSDRNETSNYEQPTGIEQVMGEPVERMLKEEDYVEHINSKEEGKIENE